MNNEAYNETDILKKANEYLKKRNFDFAKILFEKVLDKNPDNVKALYGLFLVKTEIIDMTNSSNYNYITVVAINDHIDLYQTILNHCKTPIETNHYTAILLRFFNNILSNLEFKPDTYLETIASIIRILKKYLKQEETSIMIKAFILLMYRQEHYFTNGDIAIEWYTILSQNQSIHEADTPSFEESTIQLLKLLDPIDYEPKKTIGKDFLTEKQNDEIQLYVLLADEEIPTTKDLYLAMINGTISATSIKYFLEKLNNPTAFINKTISQLTVELHEYDFYNNIQKDNSIKQHFSTFLKIIDHFFDYVKDIQDDSLSEYAKLISYLQQLGYFIHVQSYLDKLQSINNKNDDLLWLQIKNKHSLKHDYEVIQKRIKLMDLELFQDLIILTNNTYFKEIVDEIRFETDDIELKKEYIPVFSKNLENYLTYQKEVKEAEIEQHIAEEKRKKEEKLNEIKRKKEEKQQAKEERLEEKKRIKEAKKLKRKEWNARFGFVIYKLLELAMFIFVIGFLITSPVHWFFPVVLSLLYIQLNRITLYSTSSSLFTTKTGFIALLVYFILMYFLLTTGLENLIELIEGTASRLSIFNSFLLLGTVASYVYNITNYSHYDFEKVMITQFIIKYGFIHLLLFLIFDYNYITYVLYGEGDMSTVMYLIMQIVVIALPAFAAFVIGSIEQDRFFRNGIDFFTFAVVLYLILYIMNVPPYGFLAELFKPYIDTVIYILLGLRFLAAIGTILDDNTYNN